MDNKPKQKICSICGKTYAPTSSRQEACQECRTHKCDWCGKPVTDTTHPGRGRRFCSLDCTNAWQATNQAKEAARRKTIAVNGNGQVMVCKTCGESFYCPGWYMRAHPAKYCSRACRNYQADMKGINRVLRFPAHKEANQLEAAGRAILDGIGATYQEQQVIGGKFVVDALLPEQRIIIQWDGDFWHANPAQYTVLHPIQETNVKRDRACNAYLAKCGYTVLRFWETDVHSRPSWVADEVRRVLASSPIT